MPTTVPSLADRGATAALQHGSRVLVTGAGGFLGSAVVRRALADGHDVIAAIRPGGDRRRLADVEHRCQVVEADLTDAAQVRSLVRDAQPNLVVHTAAVGGPIAHAAHLDRPAVWRGTVLSTVDLLGALLDVPGAALVHVGGGTEYGPSDRSLVEDQGGQPITLRGATKLAATIAVRQWAAEQARRAVVVRPFSIYGPREQPTKLIPTLLRCAATGEAFPMLDGVSRRDLVHVDDVADGCLRAAGVAEPTAPVINIGTGVEHTVHEVVAAVERATGRSIRVSPAARPAQPHDVAHWVADTTRCRTLLGWVPPTSLAEGIDRLVAGVAA